MPEYYFEQQGKRRGPLSLERLRQLIAQGKLQPSDRVWTAENQQRVLASSVEGLFPALTPPPVSAAPSGPPPLRETAPRTVPPPPAIGMDAEFSPTSYPIPTRYAHGNPFWWIPISLGVLALLVLVAAWWWSFSGQGATRSPEEDSRRNSGIVDDGKSRRGDGSNPDAAGKGASSKSPKSPTGARLREAEARLQQAQAAYDADYRRYEQARNTALANAGRRGAMGLPPQVVQPPDPQLAQELERARAAYNQAKEALEKGQ